MSSVLRLLTHRYTLAGTGLALLVGLVMTLGAWFEWSMLLRLSLVLGLMVVFVGLVVFELIRSQRSASRIETSMRSQAEQQILSSRPDRQREIEEMQQRFDAAVDKLKRSKLGRRNGQAALHALPWYLFIGPPASGKTTAILNSGLNFPIGNERIRGVGGTRNCDWFFSDEAILLDTAGRYVTEADDEDEWFTFLDMLAENRPGRPINGVVVGISVADLLDADAYEIEFHASTIRRRIGELVEHLGVRFPVYLVFTKCDLVQGFVEFFSDLTTRERDAVWGCTFDADDAPSIDAGGRTPREAFEQAFDRLGAALSDLRLTRMRRSMKRDERHRVYVYPVEFAATKDPLAHFVGELFQPNPYEEEPEFRGFYFTSGTQEGRPIDRVIRSIADRFDLPPARGEGAAPQLETKSYFLKDLFSDVIIPDQYRVEQTKRVARTGQFKRFGVAAALAAAVVLFLLGASQAMVRSQWDVRGVQTASMAAAPVEWRSPNDASALAAVAALGDAVDALRECVDDPPFFRWGLSRCGTVLEPARRLHFAKLQPLAQSHVRSLERRLASSAAIPLQSTNEDSLRREIYADLRAYLLLTREQPRLADDTTNQTYLTHRLGDLGGPSPVVDVDAASAYDRQLDALVAGLAGHEQPVFGADASVVQRARRRILDVANLSPYDRIRTEALSAFPAVTLSRLVRPEHRMLFESDPEVPGFFTRAAWEGTLDGGWSGGVQGRIASESEQSDQGDWVLGERAVANADRDSEAVAEEIRAAYFTEYAARWRQFVSQVRLRAPSSARQAAGDLRTLGDPNASPIIYLLAQVANQTDLAEASLGDQLADASGGSSESVGSGQDATDAPDAATSDHPVNRQFAWLHALRPREAVTNPTPELTQALSALQRLSRTVEDGTQEPQQAVDLAASVIEQNGGPFAEALQASQDGLYRMNAGLRQTLFEAPVERAWAAVLGVAQQHLNRQWNERVARPFATSLASLYPFNPEASLDVALVDLETFFGPDSGTLDAFVAKELPPFYDADRQQARTWNRRGIRFSSATLRFLVRADAIQDALFAGGVVRVDFQMRPEFPERSDTAPPIGQVQIDVHGTFDTYTMGQAYWIDFVWPGRPGASLAIDVRGASVPPMTFDGDWALIRMLQQARTRPTTTTESTARWTFGSADRFTVVVPYTIRTRRAMDLFVDPVGFFRLAVPESLDASSV